MDIMVIYDMIPETNMRNRISSGIAKVGHTGTHWGTCPTLALCPTKIVIFSRSLKIAIATSYHII